MTNQYSMFWRFFVLLIAVVLCTGNKVFPIDQYRFRSYSVEQGLSQNSVFCMMQDSKGFMWFGTNDGLNRFDGRAFKVFRKTEDSNGLHSSKITTLNEVPDGRIFVGTVVGLFVYDPVLENFSLFSVISDKQQKIETRINSVCLSKDDCLWIATNGQGLFKYHIPSGELIQYRNNSDDNGSLPNNFVSKILCDSKNNLWISVAGIYQYKQGSDSFMEVFLNDGNDRRGSDFVTCFYEDYMGNMWIGTDNGGLKMYNRSTASFSDFFGQNASYYLPHIHAITGLEPGKLFIGADDALVLFDVNKGRFEKIRSSGNRPGALSDHSIYSFCHDNEGGLWLGSFFGGVNYLPGNDKKIELYQPLAYDNSLTGKAVSGFCEDDGGNIWVSTEDGGLNYFDIRTGAFDLYFSEYNVQPLLKDGNTLWVGTFGDGLFQFDISQRKIVKHFLLNQDPVSSLSIKSIFKDRYHNVWLGTNRGLFVYSATAEDFIPIEATQNLFVWDIEEDVNGLIWFVTSGNGIYALDQITGKMENHVHSEEDSTSVSGNSLLSMCVDQNNDLWFATEENGFCRYNREKNNFTRYDKLAGFDNLLIYAIVADNENDIWFTSSNGLYRFTPSGGELMHLSKNEGLQSQQFNYNSGYKASNGKLYFGGVNGFNAFFPEDIVENNFVPPVHIAGFQLFHNDVGIGSANSPLQQSITYTNEMVLKHNQNVISFDFYALSYNQSQNNQYEYIMEGFNKEWINCGADGSATYTNLPPGEYIFKVRGSNNDGIWNYKGDQLLITIKPPYYETTLAYIFYLIFILGATTLLLRSYIIRQRNRQTIQLEKIRIEKEKELYDSKLRFFTNIAHEIRTPVSLISAPVEKLLNNEKLDSSFKEDLYTIERNNQQLHALITQLLDFRKIEKGFRQPCFSKVNVSELVESIFLNFSTSARHQDIQMELQLPEEAIFADIDIDGFTKILSNLLSNALKFTSSKVAVVLSFVDERKLNFELKVSDNGPGISETDKQLIFQPFVQGETKSSKNTSGIGIGLAYSRSLIELHNGTIDVKKNPDSGASFVVVMPVNQASLSPENKPVEAARNYTLTNNSLPSAEEEGTTVRKRNCIKLLVVEDNTDMRNFLKRSLGETCEVYTASNGEVAIEMLKSHPIEMVITDLMMPVMDGVELTRQIKNNILWSHIPVIMLTAKNTLDSKVDGYESGANDYIDKPFSLELLKVRIQNLYDNHQKIKAGFARSPYVKSVSIANNKLDEAFLERMIQNIHEHLMDDDFTVDRLAEYMAMSRSGLFTKIRGISGMTPLDFIKVEKLKKAAEYLAEGKYSLSEVSLMVGYNTTSYFSKSFKKQFGVLPKDFRKSPEQ